MDANQARALSDADSRDTRSTPRDAFRALRSTGDVVEDIRRYYTVEECLAVIAEDTRIARMVLDGNQFWASGTERFVAGCIRAAYERLTSLASV